jgi:hypothetical protein
VKTRTFGPSLGIALAAALAAPATSAAAAPRSPDAVPTVAAAAPGLAAFNPQSVTFVSLSQGWALGTAACQGGGTCPTLLETTNAGTGWSARPLPAALATAVRRRGAPNAPGQWLNVRFADANDGWIFGGLGNSGPLIWSTHDGGASWRQVGLTGFLDQYNPVLDLEVDGSTVYFMAVDKHYRVQVDSSPIGSDSWRPDPTPPLDLPAGGAQLTGSIVVQGTRAWLVAGNDRGITGSAELNSSGRWVPWPAPCASVGDSYAVPAAADQNNLAVVCTIGGFGSSTSRSDPSGAALGSDWLYFSGNGGASFSTGARLPAQSYFDTILASPAPGTVLLVRSVGIGAQLAATFDGGRDWSTVYQLGPTAPFYLAFTSPSQGVGLLFVSGTTRMIMTFDGGRHWSQVKF